MANDDRLTARSPGAQRAFFDLWSRFYDLPPVQWVTYWPVHAAVLRSLRTGHAASVLDVGCGTGQLTARIVRELPGARVIGCDYSSGMLGQARARSAAVGWAQADAGELPFRDGAFDAVVSTEAFHWFPDQDRALGEFFRVLVPGGRLLLALASSPARWVGAAIRAGSGVLGEPFHWPTAEDLRMRVEAAGFVVAGQEHIARLPGGILFPPLLTTAGKPRGRRARATEVTPPGHAF